MATATLNANSLGVNGAEITLTTETLISLYVIDATGTHRNRRVTIEYSGDGTNWFPDPHSLNGHGSVLTVQVVATKARACIIAVEGSESTVNVVLIAR
tara:strand:+ start:313 stop:606 length:294 start_codon:yes stop_codon:yes gene_type:complete